MHFLFLFLECICSKLIVFMEICYMSLHCLEFSIYEMWSAFIYLFICSSLCSLYLFKLGIAPQIQDLLGKVDFTGTPQSFTKMNAICCRKFYNHSTPPPSQNNNTWWILTINKLVFQRLILFFIYLKEHVVVLQYNQNSSTTIQLYP